MILRREESQLEKVKRRERYQGVHHDGTEIYKNKSSAVLKKFRRPEFRQQEKKRVEHADDEALGRRGGRLRLIRPCSSKREEPNQDVSIKSLQGGGGNHH